MTPDSPHNVCLEVCIASLQDAVVAAEGGANRLEVNSALSLGGLTPSSGLLHAVLQLVSVPIVAMIRPRPGGFYYSDSDFTVMLTDLAHCEAQDVRGVAFGILKDDGRIDGPRCRLITEAFEGEKVFHRAFDLTPDPFEALEQLIGLGFTRVMTSGQRATALEGAETIARLIEQAKGRIEVLAAGGIRPHNVQELAARTGCTQVHASLRSPRKDASGRVNPQVRFSTQTNPRDDQYDGTDPQMVAAMREALTLLS